MANSEYTKEDPLKPLSVLISYDKYGDIAPCLDTKGDVSDSKITIRRQEETTNLTKSTEGLMSKSPPLEAVDKLSETQLSKSMNSTSCYHSNQKEAQKFQANEKISQVLVESGSFDSINDAQVLKRRIRALEIEKLALMVDHNNLICEFNKSVEGHLAEISSLNEMNEKCQKELTELRDLTCFLDDDRKKYKKIAKEWQKFGRHIVKVLKNEVISHKEKMAKSEYREKSLMVENAELRELCVHLDQGRSPKTSHVNDTTSIKTKDFMYSPVVPRNGCKNEPKTFVNVEINDRGLCLPKYDIKNDDILLSLREAQDELLSIQLLRNENRSEKKKVKFDFPDDSDTSTIDDVDNLEFPPRLPEFENLCNLPPEFSTSSRENTPIPLACPKNTMLQKFQEENLSSDHLFFPVSPKKTESNTKLSHKKTESNTKLSNGENITSTIKEERDDATDSDISTTSTTSTTSPICRGKTEKNGGNLFKTSLDRCPFDEVDKTVFI